MSDATPNEMPLALAAQKLGLSWRRAWGLVLEGQLGGRQVNGRWLVSRADTERLAQERSWGENAPVDAASATH